jgi:peptidoglycan hydrolase CwlO-like protein
MSLNFSFLSLALSLMLFSSCSTIHKKDCAKDMNAFGLSQGRLGSPKKYTDELRDKCLGSYPNIDLEAYEKGFYQGWTEYCLPNRAFEMGKKSDIYVSFCPIERESMFRQKYLIGKHHAELKDVEQEIMDKLEEIKPTIKESATNFDDFTKLQKELEKVKRDIQALEVEGLQNSFKFH